MISGAAQPKLTQDRLMNIAIAVPPRLEQDEIIAKATAQTSELSTVISRARRQIELLQEYRTRLIADVVTGKLDVRGAAVSLRDKIAERELREVVDGRANGGHESSDEVIIETAEIAVERTEDI